jgi:putative DNA methylase
MTIPRLIEVALPIREISAESVRDKNIHHAHISHLHIWWARRPLAASRAVVFASLVPDPDHPDCPADFHAAVLKFLRDDVPAELKAYRRGRELKRDPDPYHPYEGIPDTARNRLLTFIAKWSPEWVLFEKGLGKKQPAVSEVLDDRSLVKWETSDPENVQGQIVLEIARNLIRVANGGLVPTILDPFSGGGAIPLESARLGCNAVANDYDPVAYLVLRATCEYPQKYGKPGNRQTAVNEFGANVERNTIVPNVLVHDIEKWANWVLEKTREKVDNLYPAGQDGRPTLAYIWARTVTCSNPACRGEIPLIRSLLLRTNPARQVALKLHVDKENKRLEFSIVRGKDILEIEGTKRQRGPAFCPYCEQPNSGDDLRHAAFSGNMKERMIAVVVQDKDGKNYRAVEQVDLDAVKKSLSLDVEAPNEFIVPEINSPTASANSGSHRSINLELYGFTQWGQLFSHRQLAVIQEFIINLQAARLEMERQSIDPEYRQAIALYLGLWIDRVVAFSNNMCRWAPSSEIIKTPFGGQSVPMMWDYPEVNPFADSSGTASTQLEYMLKVIAHESSQSALPAKQIIYGSATNLPIENLSFDCVVTDPPYGNSIAYADLADFFYTWLKRSLGDVFPEAFVTPQTPKQQEATSHKHRHEGSQERANEHYRKILTESFKECKRVTKAPNIISVMFAHQSTDAWTALIYALFDAGLTVTATYPIETEMKSTALAMGTASLESSITVTCRPRQMADAIPFKTIRSEIDKVVKESVHRFWGYGFRGADLIVACYGPAVSVFGRYARVERADGTPVTVPELLNLARESALKAIAGEFTGDALSRLYFIWANLYGISEQSWDDVRLVVQIGGESENAMEVARGRGLFVVDGSTCRLALLNDRFSRRHLGAESHAPLIDQLHHAMQLWKEEKRGDLVNYLRENNLLDHVPYWKLAQALFEVIPRDEEDWKLISSLLGERETLRLEAKRIAEPKQDYLL